MPDNVQYKNLTELLLHVIRKRPGMYLGKNHISCLPNFILDYMFRDQMFERPNDFYFDEQGFLTWYSDNFNPRPMSFWTDYFLSETKNNETAALELYFVRLEQYYEWYMSKILLVK